MGDRTFLSEFENLVLAAALHLGEGAYGAAIMQEIENRTGRSIQAGTIYLTVQRLEEKGLVVCSFGEPGEGRGGVHTGLPGPTPHPGPLPRGRGKGGDRARIPISTLPWRGAPRWTRP